MPKGDITCFWKKTTKNPAACQSHKILSNVIQKLPKLSQIFFFYETCFRSYSRWIIVTNIPNIVEFVLEIKTKPIDTFTMETDLLTDFCTKS